MQTMETTIEMPDQVIPAVRESEITDGAGGLGQIFYYEEPPDKGEAPQRGRQRDDESSESEPGSPGTGADDADLLGVEAEALAQATYETSEEAIARDGLYGEIRRQLEEQGVRPEEVAFIHEATTAAKRAQLFRDVNAGRVRILIGSTEKMGTGTNVQEHCKALHNLDCPWRPADLEQRVGRIQRQGNTYEEVEVYNYVTESSFDAFLWSLIESKLRFISQIMAGEVTARTAEDVDQAVLTAAQIKAIASGNPKVLERVGVEVEITKLERLYSVWLASHNRYRAEARGLPLEIAEIEREIAAHRRAIETRDAATRAAREAKGKALAAAKAAGREESESIFEMTLKARLGSEETVTFRRREDAGAHLRQLAYAVARQALSFGSVTRELGSYLGFRVHASASAPLTAGRAFATLIAEPEILLKLEGSEVGYACSIGESDAGIPQSVDAQLRHIERRLETAERRLQTNQRRHENIQRELESGWEYAERYQELRARLEALNLELASEDFDLDSGTAPSALTDEAFNPVFSTRLIAADEETLSQETAPPSAEEVTAGSGLEPDEPEVFAPISEIAAPADEAEEMRVEPPLSLATAATETPAESAPDFAAAATEAEENEAPEAAETHAEAGHPLASYMPVSAHTWDELFDLSAPSGKKKAKARKRAGKKQQTEEAPAAQLGFSFD